MSAYYFDYAAATPLDASVEAAMQPFARELFHNPSSLYLSGRAAHDALEQARGSVASGLGVTPATITFTAGVTEANNLLIQGLAQKHPNSHMIISAIEHESVYDVVESLEGRGLVEFDVAPVDKYGRLKLDELEALIKPSTVLLSVIHIHNEFGTIQDLPAVARIRDTAIKQRKQERPQDSRPLILHTDAAQSANYTLLSISKLQVDAMSLSAAKLYGPKQVGALYIRRGLALPALLAGGGQEHGLRPGTPNVAGAVGLAAAFKQAQAQHKTEQDRLVPLHPQLVDGLSAIPTATIHGQSRHQVPSFVSVGFDGQDGERLVMELDERGIQLGTGSACNAGTGEPSRSLLALGLTPQQARSTIRVSMGRFTTREHIEYLLNSLRAIIS